MSKNKTIPTGLVPLRVRGSDRPRHKKAARRPFIKELESSRLHPALSCSVLEVPLSEKLLPHKLRHQPRSGHQE